MLAAMSMTRRSFLRATAASATLPAFHIPPRRRVRHPVSVSSSNGFASLELTVDLMADGVSPVDAAVRGVEPVENDPRDSSVGYGGLPNADGVVELDSCVMDGPTGLAGAVGALRNIKNPAQVALKVMRNTDHVLLVGEGALRFARMHGFAEENLLTESSRERWLKWRQDLSTEDDWVDDAENEIMAPGTSEGAAKRRRDRKDLPPRPTGTIHIGCVNADGQCGGVTTTSGLAFKVPGRVGDSPLIGCGNYVDNQVGVAGSTGRGEAVILINGASTIMHFMRSGMTPTDACLAACKRVAETTKVKRLLTASGRPDFQVNFYAVSVDGVTGGAAIYPSRYARCGENGPERVDSAYLFETRK